MLLPPLFMSCSNRWYCQLMASFLPVIYTIEAIYLFVADFAMLFWYIIIITTVGYYIYYTFPHKPLGLWGNVSMITILGKWVEKHNIFLWCTGGSCSLVSWFNVAIYLFNERFGAVAEQSTAALRVPGSISAQDKHLYDLRVVVSGLHMWIVCL